ncbi:MAG: glycosyltransferase [Pseudarthrobacter sp.]
MALELGGAESHVISLARELHRRGQRVVVASAGGHLVEELTKLGIPHAHVPMDSRSPVEMARAYFRLRRVIDTYRVGLVHAHARIPAFVSALVLRGSRVPFVSTYHGVYAAGFPWRYLTRFGQRTIAVSEDVRQHLIERLGAPAKQVRLIPNGFDTELFHPGVDIAPLLTEFGVQASEPHLVSAGRLDDDLFEVPMSLVAAIPALERQIPGVRLWILGDGTRIADVRRAAEAMNRQLGRQAVVATGARRDVHRFFNLADCVVAVARTAVEAMACARPVVIAGQGGYRGLLTPERIEEYARTNFTAREGGRPPSPELLEADILRVLRQTDGSELRRMGEAGRTYVVENLSIDAITARILDVYAEVLS